MKHNYEEQKKIVQNSRLDSGLKHLIQPRCHKEVPLGVFSTSFIHVGEFSWLMVIIVSFSFHTVITSSKTNSAEFYTATLAKK